VVWGTEPKIGTSSPVRAGSPHTKHQTQTQTPNLQPQIPNPKPQTPNPKPQTSDLKPQTPNTKHQTPSKTKTLKPCRCAQWCRAWSRRMRRSLCLQRSSLHPRSNDPHAPKCIHAERSARLRILGSSKPKPESGGVARCQDACAEACIAGGRAYIPGVTISYPNTYNV